VDLHLAFSLLARLYAFICGFSRSIVGSSIEKRLLRRGFPLVRRSIGGIDERRRKHAACNTSQQNRQGELLNKL